MKFLCVPCNEQMQLQEVEGPDQGSLTVVFHCLHCTHRIALLTNPWETQLVKALEVDAPSEGLRAIRSSLASQREEAFVTDELGEEVEAAKEAGGCPFAAVIRQAEEGDFVWTEAAEERLQRIPEFVRSSVKRAIEGFAREKRHRTITDALMDEARKEIGM